MVIEVGEIYSNSTTIKLLAREGEVLDARTHAGTNYRTTRHGKKVTLHQDNYESTAFWVRWEDGSQDELQSLPGSVTALPGQRLRVIFASNGRWELSDLARINMSSNRYSVIRSVDYVAETIAEKLFGKGERYIVPGVLSLALAFGVFKYTEIASLAILSITSWPFFQFVVNMPYKRLLKKIKNSVLPAIDRASNAKFQ
ncbi:hypothetical protein RE428_10430 [Marinobacter nanhaiticus D15-8W]|uniref:Uncharacterized protein n=1 Tax=Marinobacter nanhaiticus D15-8W TaxID=626887 RepID=N6WMJ7_9GAMM|nr:hypothetical protein [Marinobacter nanhaiticus]ENO12686.1 hypothetical protein J057_14830 [Marinobacter nanhaiticus D15-8W]BES70025.1 hypothetical protein RE428_10430 [Marinobacter nanhaiticus D15-8W]